MNEYSYLCGGVLGWMGGLGILSKVIFSEGKEKKVMTSCQWATMEEKVQGISCDLM